MPQCKTKQKTKPASLVDWTAFQILPCKVLPLEINSGSLLKQSLRPTFHKYSSHSLGTVFTFIAPPHPAPATQLPTCPSPPIPLPSSVWFPFGIGSSRQKSSQQVGQNETRGFGLHTIDPEVGTAGMVLVPSVSKFEIVSLRIKGLGRKNTKHIRILLCSCVHREFSAAGEGLDHGAYRHIDAVCTHTTFLWPFTTGTV